MVRVILFMAFCLPFAVAYPGRSNRRRSPNGTSDADFPKCPEEKYVILSNAIKKPCFEDITPFVDIDILVTKRMNWFDANLFCRREGMALTTKLSPEKYLKLAERIQSNCNVEDITASFWVGLNVVQHMQNPECPDNNWSGVNGETPHMSKWTDLWLHETGKDRRNPDRLMFENCPGITFESCVELLVSGDKNIHGKLNDRNCYHQMNRFICTKRFYR